MSQSWLEARLGAEAWPNREHSRLVKRGGIDWHVQTMGSGPVLLLLHGTGASTHSFRDLMPALAQRYTVLAPDLPGHAFSLAPPRFVPSLSAMAAALEELLEELKLTPALVVGHSAGAAVAARMMLNRALEPKLLVGLAAALVPFRGATRAVFLPAAKLLAQSELAAKVLAFQARDGRNIDRLVKSTGSTLDAQGLHWYQRLSRQPAHVAGVLSMMANWDLEPLYDELPRVDGRVLLLAGEGDLAVPVSQQREVARLLPNAQLTVLPKLGHLFHEEEPAMVARLIADADADQIR